MPWGLALDVPGNKMYWLENSKLRRSTLDGKTVEDLVTLGELGGIDVALDLPSKVYFSTGSSIQRAKLDGSSKRIQARVRANLAKAKVQRRREEVTAEQEAQRLELIRNEKLVKEEAARKE